MKTESWSTRLIAETKEAFSEQRINPSTGCLHLKCIDGQSGIISAIDLLSDRLVIETTTKETVRFPNVDAMIQAGWAID